MGFISDLFRGKLHAAIRNGDSGKVEHILAGGADPNETCLQKTPLMIAAKFSKLETVKLLLDNGATVEARDRQGNTALMFAAAGWGYRGPDREDRCMAVVRFLLEKGAVPDARGKRGQTAMRYALGAGNRRVMEVLRRHGVNDCCYESDSSGDTCAK